MIASSFKLPFLVLISLAGCSKEPEQITRASLELSPHAGDALDLAPPEFVVRVSGPIELVRPVLSVTKAVSLVRLSDGRRWELVPKDSPGNETFNGSEFQNFQTPAGLSADAYEFIVELSDWGVPVDGACASGHCLVARGSAWVAAFTLR